MSADVLTYLTAGDYCECQNLVQLGLGLTKVADLTSDILFIVTLTKFYDVFVDGLVDAETGESISPIGWIISSVIFTLIGFVYDVAKSVKFCKKKCCRDEDDDDDNSNNGNDDGSRKHKTCCELSNLYTEEIPQFLILAAFSGTLLTSDSDCTTIAADEDQLARIDVECTPEQIDYSNDVFRDALISFFFTSISFVRGIIAHCRLCCRKCGCSSDQHGSKRSDTSFDSSSTDDNADCAGSGNDINCNPCHPIGKYGENDHSMSLAPPIHHFNGSDISSPVAPGGVIETVTMYADGSKTIKRETYNEDGSKTVTVTNFCS